MFRSAGARTRRVRMAFRRPGERTGNGFARANGVVVSVLLWFSPWAKMLEGTCKMAWTMARRSAAWKQWGSVTAVLTALLAGGPEAGWGQAKPDAAALDEVKRLNDEIIKLYGAGKYDPAITLAERTLAIVEKAFGPDDLEVATSLNNLGLLYKAKGDYERAEPFYQRALATLEKVLGTDDGKVATSLNNLAALYYAKGDYGRAEPLYQRALAIMAKAFGTDHLDVAILLDNLALLYKTQGDYARAEPLYQRALAIWEKARGNDHPDVAVSLNNLAALYDTRGDYARAEPLYLRAIAIWEKALGKDNPHLATSLNNLGLLYKAKGDYVRAKALYHRALAIREKALGLGHLDVAQSLSSLAVLYSSSGDYTHAHLFFLTALDITERALGKDHPQVATSLDNLATLYAAKGDYARAEPLYQRALAIWEKVRGKDHPDVALSLNNLAELYRAKSDYARAEPLYQRALAVWEKALGPDHPNVAALLHNRSVLHWAQNDVHLALQALERGISIEDRNATRELAVGTDEQRRAYMQQLGVTTKVTISLHIQLASSVENAKHLALRTILRRKGLVIDAMANSFGNLRERLSADDQNKFDEWNSLTTQYSALMQRGPDKQPLEAFQALVQDVNEQRQKLENDLSFASKDLQGQLTPVTIEQVQAALPEGAALVELYWYEPFNPKATGTENPWGTPRFVAYVLHRDGTIDFADLGEAKPIEDAAQALRDLLPRDAADPKPAAQRLHQLVMAPIQKLLGNTRHIYLSPDGALALVPFEALIDETGHYLVESFAITYLSSGRDLVRRSNSAPSREADTVFAGPDYEAGTKPETRPRYRFEPLRYAKAEAKAIASLVPGTSSREGAAATEAALKALHAPKILHISTHGFFEKDLPALHEPPRDAFQIKMRPPPPVENALLRSGLAFAGANRSGLGKEDGLLTALEASKLDLWGTKLVVLSACNTGNGQVENGDSVYGLRRAFAIAGAETVVMSLWQVEGRATTDLMKSYYQGLAKGGGRAEALRQAQLAMLHGTERSHPSYWASFIVSGDDRSMEGRPVEPSFGRINRGGCGGACAMGASEGIELDGFLGIVLIGAIAAMRRRNHFSSVA